MNADVKAMKNADDTTPRTQAQVYRERQLESLRRMMGDELMGFLQDPDIVEIMLNQDGRVWVDILGGEMEPRSHMDPVRAKMLIEVVASILDTSITKENPIISGELPLDGSRFEAQIPPIVLAPTFAIRKKALMVFTLDDYVQQGSITPAQKMKLVAAVRERKNILVSGGTGCHAKGTEILMADGSLKKVEAIRVGDTVMGPDSTPREVLRLHRGIEPMYRIIPNKGEPFVVNAGHYLALESTPRQKGAPRRKVEITVRDYLQQSAKFKHLYKLYRVPVDFPPLAEPLPIDPYFLGVLLGDGGFMGSISVTKPDIEIRDEVFAQAANYDLHVNTYYRSPNNPSYRLCGQDKGPHHHNRLIRQLAALHLHRQPWADKFIPQHYKVASRKERLQLLAGLLDTDGYYDGHHFELTLKAETLARDITFVARTLGFHASVTPCNKGCQTGAVGTYYRVYIGGDLSGIPTRIFRKQAMAKHRRTQVLVTGFQVEPVGVGAYYGIEVTKDHLYLLSDCLVTRNSGKSTLCNAILDTVSQETPEHRVVVIEDTLELQVNAPNMLSLRVAGDVDMQRLLKSTMRMRPDRIVVGEVRGKEALDLLKAWGTGHPGGVGTVHANDALAALTRLEMLIQEANVPPNPAFMAEVVNIIINIKKTATGRMVDEILAVDGYDKESGLFITHHL